MATLIHNPIYARTEYSASVIGSVEAFRQIKEAWESLLSEAKEARLCLSHPWLLEYLTQFPCEPFIILVYQSGRLVGAAPLKINRKRSGLIGRMFQYAQFIGTDPCVYDSTGFILSPEGDQQRILEEISNLLLKYQSQWDVLDFRFLSSQEPLQVIQSHLNQSKKGYTSQLGSPMSLHTLELPAEIDSYERILHKKLRNTLNNAKNRISREYTGSLRLEEAQSPEEAAQYLNDFARLHIYSWKQRGVRSDFSRYPDLKRFYLQMHRQLSERFRLTSLKINNTPISYQICLNQGQSSLSYLVGYHQEYKAISPGSLHFDALIREAISNGYTAHGFGRGNEEYKTRWVNQTAPLWNLTVYKNRPAYVGSRLDDQLISIKNKLSGGGVS